MAPTPSNRTSEQLRAVVCDDDAVSRRLASSILGRTGFDVVAEVSSALEAIRAVRVCAADVVILDHSLVGVTGTDAIPALRAAAPHCAIVVFSAFETAKQALAAGARDVIRKGSTAELAAALDTIGRERRPT